MGNGRGDLYLAISNGYPGGQERIHLFRSTDSGGNWRPVDVNFPEAKKRGDTGSPQVGGWDGRPRLPGLARPDSRTEGGRLYPEHGGVDVVDTGKT